MKTFIRITTFIIIIFIATSSILSSPGYNFSSFQNFKLTIKVSGFDKIIGKLRIGLYNNADNFPKEKEEYKTAVIIVNSNVMKYTFNIPAGSYAVAIFHDENSDGVCNTNFLGIPEEGYGFSNNIKPLLSAPTFDEAKVSVKKDTEIEIHLIY